MMKYWDTSVRKWENGIKVDAALLLLHNTEEGIIKKILNKKFHFHIIVISIIISNHLMANRFHSVFIFQIVSGKKIPTNTSSVH